ncbi:MAG: AbrB/MazE/SpoVT family DNA-binding domain-containing protein [Candidatus Omnitrophota bacterium]|jgi:AbrB family looped-hinge helix DNA binding protein|nr:AbrB/MazE/SpoVT family DNA-binding domain-containing protein [Candidatus Omnitrophota bacterium]
MKNSPQVYGTVTIGQRGQVVIPMKVRKEFKIKPGDQLIVMAGPPGRKDMINFLPVERVSSMLNHFEEHLSVLKKEISKSSSQ